SRRARRLLHGAPTYWPAGGLASPPGSTFEHNRAPRRLLNRDAFDVYGCRPGVGHPDDLFLAPTGGLVHGHPAWQAARVAMLVQPRRPGHHRPHLLPSEVRVVQVACSPHVVRDELHPTPLGIEYL